MLKVASLGFRFFLGLLILGGAFGIFELMLSTREAPELKPEVFRPMLVRGTRLEPQMVARSWSGYGTALAMDRSDIPAEVSARVISRPESTEVGLHVERGQVLFQLDPFDFDLAAGGARENIAALEAQIEGLKVEEDRLARQLELAEQETTLAQRDFERARDTIRLGAGTEAEIDARLAAVRRAERVASALRQQVDLIPTRRADLQARTEAQRIALRQAEENLRRATIVAPISGVIQSADLKQGEWAQSGRVVARVVSLERIEVPLRVPISASAFLGVGAPVDIRSRVEDAQGWSGSISRIAPEADGQTRSLTVFVEVRQDPSASRVLRPGQFVAGRVHCSTPSEQIVVPRRAIVADRILIAAKTENPEAGIWPVAGRIAEALARGAVRRAHPSMDDPDIADSLAESMSVSAKIEVGESASSLAGAVAAPTAEWMGSAGSQTIEDQFVRVLRTHLTPQVATWLVGADRAALPALLRAELDQSERLWAVRAVPVASLYTVEGAFPAIDPDERQWVVIRTDDTTPLAGAVLLTTNLDQLIDGMLVDVAVGGGP